MFTFRVAAASIIAEWKGESSQSPFTGAGSCYVEFGQDLVGRVDVDFFSGPKPTGTFSEPSEELVIDKQYSGSSRAARWFGVYWCTSFALRDKPVSRSDITGRNGNPPYYFRATSFLYGSHLCYIIATTG